MQDDDRSDAATVGTSVAGTELWEDDDEESVAGFEAVKRWTLRVNFAKPDPVVEDPGQVSSATRGTAGAGAGTNGAGAAADEMEGREEGEGEGDVQMVSTMAEMGDSSSINTEFLHPHMHHMHAGDEEPNALAVVVERPTRSPSPPAVIDPGVLTSLVPTPLLGTRGDGDEDGLEFGPYRASTLSDAVYERIQTSAGVVVVGGGQGGGKDGGGGGGGGRLNAVSAGQEWDWEDRQEQQQQQQQRQEDQEMGSVGARGQRLLDMGDDDEGDVRGVDDDDIRHVYGAVKVPGEPGIGIASAAEPSEGGRRDEDGSVKVFSDEADVWKHETDNDDEVSITSDWIVLEEEQETSKTLSLKSLPKKSLVSILIYSGNPNLLKTCRRLSRLPLPELGHDLAQLVVAFIQPSRPAAPSKASTSDAPTLVSLSSSSSHNGDLPAVPEPPPFEPSQHHHHHHGSSGIPPSVLVDPAVLLPRCARAACLNRSPLTLPCLARLLGPTFIPTHDTLGAVMEIAARGRRWNTVRGSLALARHQQQQEYLMRHEDLGTLSASRIEHCAKNYGLRLDVVEYLKERFGFGGSGGVDDDGGIDSLNTRFVRASI
ncbi:hypothetical protein HDU97_007621 [Phlyctochytrium planicorne]|nr:hypothetical protein HDU97_007621 [Phlyctochytrium planicorne]